MRISIIHRSCARIIMYRIRVRFIILFRRLFFIIRVRVMIRMFVWSRFITVIRIIMSVMFSCLIDCRISLVVGVVVLLFC